MKIRFTQALVLSLLCMVGPAPASGAQDPAAPAAPPAAAAAPGYAVMSLLGNSISIVVFQPTIGTNMDANKRHDLPINDLMFDTAAIESANAALKLRQPTSNTVLMATRDAGLYQAQNDMFEHPDANRENRDYLKSLLKDRPVTYLILITKLRGPAEVKMASSSTGNGRLEGLGFYMDSEMETMDTATLDSGRGILGAFAYVKARMIDAKTLDVVREVYLKHSGVVGNSNQDRPERLAWNILTPKQKIDFLNQQIRAAVGDVIPLLFKQG